MFGTAGAAGTVPDYGCDKLSLDFRVFMGYIIVMKVTREEREMLELVGLFVAAVMAVPVFIFALAMLLCL